jgi:DNA/RNA-binding domain of Phe-tRNA-synthetase-like protein
LKKFIVENAFWELFPEAKIGVVVVYDIDNTVEDVKKYEGILREAEKQAMNHLKEAVLSENEVIKVWRDAFQKFKTKKGVRSSIEALLKRVHKGNQIGNINPLVDLYNSVSLKHALPCGGEDKDNFAGNIKLTKAQGDEPFVTLGTDKNESPYKGEIVYKDDEGAICRCWNWRESARTCITDKTKNAFLCIEMIDSSRQNDFDKALKELGALIKDNLGGTYKIEVLSIHNKEVEIG